MESGTGILEKLQNDERKEVSEKVEKIVESYFEGKEFSAFEFNE